MRMNFGFQTYFMGEENEIYSRGDEIRPLTVGRPGPDRCRIEDGTLCHAISGHDCGRRLAIGKGSFFKKAFENNERREHQFFFADIAIKNGKFAGIRNIRKEPQ
ncbi:MAG TPA: hypothetical protein VI893_01335 [Thermoplasmata archaeon]|nr:hypothetical protein [Thermoplasmata archaeon]